MGYCYDSNGRLCCDCCGASGNGTRKRTCPYRVTYAEGGSLPYCSPSALCSTCYAKHKATLHADCKARAEQETARQAARKARLAAGDYERRTAWGDWHARVPAGMVGVRFVGLHGEVYRLLPHDSYASGDWLSDYPAETPEWAEGAQA